MSRQRVWMLMLSTILWETDERLYYHFRDLSHFPCYCQDVLHHLDGSWRRLQRILFLCCLEGRRMDIPHTHTFVFASRIYTCHCGRFVTKSRFRLEVR